MRVDIGGCRLFFDVEGAKLRPDGPRMREVPTLLLLHGGPGADHSIFKPAYSRLADIVQVVYFDHRGDGRSDGRDDSARWKLSQWGDDVKALCDALEIERPIVMGVSFGGYVAMSYALRHPDHPAKLILCSTAASPSKKEIQVKTFERLGGAEAGAAAQSFSRRSHAGCDARVPALMRPALSPQSSRPRHRRAHDMESALDG